MSILLHICCAPCAIGPYEGLTQSGIDVTGLFFNPNIHPFLEYRNRLAAAREVADALGVEIVQVDDYGLTQFLSEIEPKESDRCSVTPDGTISRPNSATSRLLHVPPTS